MIKEHIKSEEEFRITFRRRSYERFRPLQRLEQLQNDAVRLRTSAHNVGLDALIETCDHLSNDSFEEVLERKIYQPTTSHHQLNGGNTVRNTTYQRPSMSEQAIDSLDSFEPQFLSQRDTLSPYQAQQAGPTGYYNSKPGVIPSKLSFITENQRDPRKLDPNFPSNPSENMQQPSIQRKHGSVAVFTEKLVFDHVYNFETYFPMGNISVISHKYNEATMRQLVTKHLNKQNGTAPTKNVLRSIDILSRGSVFASIRRDSVDSLQSGSGSLNKGTQKHSDISRNPSDLRISARDSHRDSFTSSVQGNSGFLQPNSPDAAIAKRPSIFKSTNSRFDQKQSSSRRDSLLAPSNMAELSFLSNTSLFNLEKNEEGQDIQSPKSPGASVRRSKFFKLSSNPGLPNPPSSNSPSNPMQGISPSSSANLGKGDEQSPRVSKEKSHMGSAITFQGSVPTNPQPTDSDPEPVPKQILPSISEKEWSEQSDSRKKSIKMSAPIKNVSSFMSRKDSNNTEFSMGHQNLINTFVTFQNPRPSEDHASSFHHPEPTKLVVKHLLRALAKLKERTATSDSMKGSIPSKPRRSRSAGAYDPLQRLAQTQGYSTVLKQYMLLLDNENT